MPAQDHDPIGHLGQSRGHTIQERAPRHRNIGLVHPHAQTATTGEDGAEK
jgi:hypothetical protein